MNEKVKIKVKTPLGTSETEESGPTVTQGGVEAGIVSSNNVDVGMEEAFNDEDKEIRYKELTVKGLSYMDDIMCMSENLENAEYGNRKMEECIGRKNLSFNLDKSNYVIVGSNKERKKLNKKLREKPHITMVKVK